jgi:16S rRNA (cytidine1402-2'-O)-methyltransferase
MKENAGLFLVPTPIGNLEDITLRALRILSEVDLILAEDTRTSKKLLDHYQIENRLLSYHAFNEHKISNQIISRLETGEKIALITDAGTPGISDPGYLLVKKCIEKQIEIECLPGPTAFIPALILSGLPNDRFVFEGFMPHKKGRKTRLGRLRDESRTMIFYESPHRLVRTLREFYETFGEERTVSVSRELTKKFEETVRGTFPEVIQYFSQKTVKGEFVIVVDGINHRN